MFAVGFNASHPNTKWMTDLSFIARFRRRLRNISLNMMCDAAIAYGCSATRMYQSSTEDNSTECVDEYDEDYALVYCFRTRIALEEKFQCSSMNSSLIGAFTFRKRCFNEREDDDDGKFQSHQNMNRPRSRPNVTCWDGSIRTASRCSDPSDCRYGEDRFLCGQEGFLKTFYRAEKQDQVRQKKKKVKLPSFPVDPVNSFSPNPSNLDQMTTPNSTIPSAGFSPRSDVLPLLNWCNRGVPIWTQNGTHVCFCPPHYHGDQCQFHTDRITFFAHVNYTHSDYTTHTDPNILHKFLVILHYDGQVVNTDEFHVRPATEIPNYRKKKTYLHYSRSPQHMKKKQERYFNRSSIIHEHPFSIRIEAYEIKPNRPPRRFAVWRYLILFDFLPVHRFATVLRFIARTPDDLDPCLMTPCGKNEECYRVQNERSQYLCLCKSGFFGENCSHSDPQCSNGYCSSNAVCQSTYRGLTDGQNLPYCICPSGHTGQRCELLPDKCSEKPCQNGGSCVQRSKPNEHSCLCAEEYHGSKCEKSKPSIHLQLIPNVTAAYQVIIEQYLKIDMVTFELKSVGQRLHTQLPRNFTYYHDSFPVPEIVLLKFYHLDRSDMYVLSLRTDQVSIRTNTSVSDYNRCKPAESFFSTGEGSIIKYHHVCKTEQELLCFFDDIYLCICVQNHSRAECFNHDHTGDKCQRCEAYGRCLKGRNDSDFHCICPACHTGRFCQFSFDSFSFTLDQLFFADLLSPNSRIRHATYYSLIIAPLLLILIGLLNNVCCFVTFRRPRCLRNGTGHYLYAMALCNQLTLAFLALRLIHLTLNISSPYSFPALDNALCKTSNYLLAASTRLTYWLGSLVAIERVYVALFVNGQWLKKPQIAQRIIAMAAVTILTVSAYQLAFIHSRISSDDGNNAMCTISFPSDRPVWLKLHIAMTVIDSVGPFLTNLVCTVSIICLVTKKKMNATGRRDTRSPESNVVARQNRLQLLRTVLIDNKELVIGPAFTLIPQLFSLPYFIASLMMQCQNLQGSGLRYLLTASYFTTFVPALMSFYLYISPSSFYSQEWQATTIGKWLRMFKRREQVSSLITRSALVADRTK